MSSEAQSKRTADQQTVTTKDEKEQINEVQTKLTEEPKGLTCDKDTALTQINYCQQPNMFKALNPFIDQTPTAILTRQYKVMEFNITPSLTRQTLIMPQALLALPAITKALSSFYYFRSDVEIAVKLNSTPYHQGMLQTSFYHDVKNGVLANMPNMQQMSTMHAVYYNYATSDAATMTFGWLHPLGYMNIPATNNDAYIGVMFFDPVVPVANTSGGTTTITCTVYARFINPRTAGFRNEAPAEGQAGKVFKFNSIPETISKSKEVVPVTDASDDIISPLFKSINVIPGAITTVMDLFSHLTKLLDKPRDISNVQKMNYQVGEDMITGAGIVQADRLTLYPTSKLANFPLAPMCADSTMPIVKIAQKPMLFDTYTFDSTHLTYNIYAHPMSVGTMGYHETSVANAWAQPDYLATMTSVARYWKGGIKYFLYFVTNSFTTARFRISYIIDYNETDLAYGGDFPSQIVDIKGSTEVPILVPFLHQLPYKLTIPPGGAEGYTLSPKITVELLSLPVSSQGTAPFITLCLWRAAAEDFQIASLQTSVLNPFLLHPPDSIKHKKKEIAKGQASLDEMFTKVFTPIACDCKMMIEQGYTTTETIGTCNDVLKRFQEMADEPESLIVPRSKPGVAGTANGSWLMGPGATEEQKAQSNAWNFINNLFKYQRGAMRYRYIQDGEISTTETIYFTPTDSFLAGTLDSGGGVTVWRRDMNPIYTQEKPWIGTVPYYGADDLGVIIPTEMHYVDTAHSNMGTGVGSYKAIGDDRILSYLLPPAAVWFVPPGNTSNSSKTQERKTEVKEENKDVVPDVKPNKTSTKWTLFKTDRKSVV